MWFGTANGLNRYDGYEFKLFSADSSDKPFLTSSVVQVLYEDDAGYIWIGTRGGLNCYDPKQDKMYRYLHDSDDPASLTGNWIKCIHQDSENNIWIGTKNDGISCLRNSYIHKEIIRKNSFRKILN